MNPRRRRRLRGQRPHRASGRWALFTCQRLTQLARVDRPFRPKNPSRLWYAPSKGEPVAHDVSSPFPRAMIENRTNTGQPGKAYTTVAKLASASAESEAKLAKLRAEVEARKAALAKALRPSRVK